MILSKKYARENFQKYSRLLKELVRVTCNMNKTIRRKVFGFPPSYEKFGFLNPQILFEELERIVGDVNKTVSSIMKISNQDVEFN